MIAVSRNEALMDGIVVLWRENHSAIRYAQAAHDADAAVWPAPSRAAPSATPLSRS